MARRIQLLGPALFDQSAPGPAILISRTCRPSTAICKQILELTSEV
jgi:hypothetical protein